MKKSILFGLLVVFFGGLLVSTVFAGAPPSAKGPAEGPGGPTTFGKKRGAISFDLGYYNPSFKTLNDELKTQGFPEIGGGIFFSGRFSPKDAPLYMGLGYWSGSSTRKTDSTEVKLWLLPVLYDIEVPILTGTLPEQITLYLGLGGKFLYSHWRWETTGGDYYNADALGYDIGVKFGGDFFIVPNMFSIGGSIGYIFLGKTGQLTVTDSTFTSPEVNDKLITSDGEKFVFELSGISLMFNAKLYF